MNLPASAPPPNDPQFKRMRTLCPVCLGKGENWTPRAAIIGGELTNSGTPTACKTCKGKGRLPGFQPPA